MAKRHVEGKTETKKVTLYNVLSQRRRQFEHSVDLCWQSDVAISYSFHCRPQIWLLRCNSASKATSSLSTRRLVFCGYHLMKLPQTPDCDVFVILLGCAPGASSFSFYCGRSQFAWRQWYTPLYEIFTFVAISHIGIALISKNKNRLTIFRGKLYFCGHIETIIQPTHADSAATQLRKEILLLL